MDISKKVFGANVSKDIRQYFKALQEGNFTIEPGDSVSDAVDYQAQTYLGDRTPYARMWTAVNVREEISGEEEGPSLPGGGRGFGRTIIYSINENRENFYESNEMSQIYNAIETDFLSDFSDDFQVGVSYKDQLTNNPLMKPESGITSINSKSEGAVGALRRTTVNFSVHNKQDFEQIYLPFFLKPGATVFVDLGWSDKALSLYSPESIIENENPSMDNFYNKIYGEDTVGEIEKGFRTTLSGQVTKYDVNVDEKGSFNCTLEFVSSNYALLDKSVSDDNSLKFIFKNLMEELILKYYLSFAGIDITDSTLDDTNKISIQERQKLVKEFFDADTNPSNVGLTDTLSKKSGVFYQNITGKTSKEDRLDEKEALYISYGLLEDRFLNKFISYWITTDDEGKEEKKLKSDEAFSNSFSSQNSYVRFDDDLYKLQGLDYRNSDERMSFLYPDNWDNTHNTLKPTTWNSTKDDKLKRKIPLRDLFIAVPIISEAFAKSSNVNDALEFIFDQIYNDSGNILNIKMIPNNDAQSSITFQDINVEADKFEDGDEEILKFDLTSGKTIVLNSDLKFETPKGGLSSMIAIGNQKNVSVFDELELIKFNFLNAISGEDRKYKVQHLPVYGEMPSTKKGLDLDIKSVIFNKNVDTTFIAGIDIRGKPKNNQSNSEYLADRFKTYVDSKREQINNIENKPKKETDENPEEATPPPTETSDGKPIFYSKSERDTYLLKAKINNFVKTNENSISPVMPISLSLKVYGNNFLGIGDFFTVNFLPKHYQDRVYFQIVGIDHGIGTSMWETTYTTVMRLKSTLKYKQFGNKNDFEIPTIILDAKLIKKKAQELTKTSDVENINLGEKELISNIEPGIMYLTEDNTKTPDGLTIVQDIPLVTLQYEVVIYNSKLEGNAAKSYGKTKREIQNGNIIVGGYTATTDNISKEKISISVQEPKTLSNGELSYWIIMSNLILGDELINWEQIKKDYSKIEKSKEVGNVPKFQSAIPGRDNLTVANPNLIRVTTSLPNEEDKNGSSIGNPTYASIMKLFDEEGPSYGFDETQKIVNNLIQSKGKSQKISTHIDNSILEKTKRGGFYFFRSIVWPIIPDVDNRIVSLTIEGHPDFKILSQLKIPQKYLKMGGQELVRRIRKDYSVEKNKNYDLEDYFNKNRKVDPGFPFVNPYFNSTQPHGTSANSKEARERLGKKFGFNNYEEYKAARDAEGESNTRRKVDWRNSSDIW